MRLANISSPHPTTSMFASMQTPLSWALLSVFSTVVQGQNTTLFGPAAFTAPGVFPTSVYSHYYNSPTATSAQVQPVISDPVLHKVYPAALTNPDNVPGANQDPHPLPSKASPESLLQSALQQVSSINSSPLFGSQCAKCLATLEVVKFAALAAPEQVPDLLIGMCQTLGLSSNCPNTYARNNFGSVITQVIANADIGGLDGQLLCQHFFSGNCPRAPASPLNLTGWFAKPKPNPLPVKAPSGQRLKVLHISDLHLDPRYATGSEANCTSGLCCRAGNPNTSSPQKVLFPAPRFGAMLCDSPYALAVAAMQAIPVLTGTEKSGFAFSVYTGDLVSHDQERQLSRDYVEYTETVIYDLFKRMLGSGPVYAALGNHDSYNQAQDAPKSLGGQLAEQYSWNYDHVARLWGFENWLPEGTVNQARAHYGGYSVQRKDKLRIITLNTDLWYSANWFNYINMTNPDTSGMLRFLTDELQAAEDVGDRVWIVGHVLSGWDGTNPLLNPTNLFYQIVDRYSPHVIANIVFGHTHEDQFSIFYQNNGTVMNADTAAAVAWMGPSLTPLTGLNGGFRVYEVDSATFDVLDAHTWYTDVSTFPSLDSQLAHGPSFAYEYSTRNAYGANIGWGPNDPLNATWWHLVTEAMLKDPSLVAKFTQYQGKLTFRAPPCSSADCVQAKVCYMRSGSAPIALQNCKPGFGSVQGR